MTALALIIGRAGSRGVPGKNVADVAGRPCIEWTIDAALDARLVDRVAVSSDCRIIRGIAERRGLTFVERPAELASSRATVDDAARHAVDQLDDPELREVCLLYANVPVRPRGVIDRAIHTLRAAGADSVQSYQPVGKHHPWWTVRVDDDERVSPWEGSVLNNGVFRRQDLPLALIPDGAVLAVTRDALYRRIPGVDRGPHAFFGRDRRAVINPEGSVVDIDSDIDLIVARAIMEREETECASQAEPSARPLSRTSSQKSA